jgi:hypothetical protein
MRLPATVTVFDAAAAVRLRLHLLLRPARS